MLLKFPPPPHHHVGGIWKPAQNLLKKRWTGEGILTAWSREHFRTGCPCQQQGDCWRKCCLWNMLRPLMGSWRYFFQSNCLLGWNSLLGQLSLTCILLTGEVMWTCNWKFYLEGKCWLVAISVSWGFSFLFVFLFEKQLYVWYLRYLKLRF